MKADEQTLVKLYMDLTGATESCARSVFMHVCLKDDKTAEDANAFWSNFHTGQQIRDMERASSDGTKAHEFPGV